MSEIDYFVDEKSVVDHTVLSQRSRDMCDGLPMYWMDRDYHQGSKTLFEYRHAKSMHNDTQTA